MVETFYTNTGYGDQVRTEAMYVDGACRGNNIYGERQAGVGVFLGNGDYRNRSIYLGCGNITNQYAELYSIRVGLTLIWNNIDDYGEPKYLIRSDSKYAINCLTVWYSKWINNGWRNCYGNEVSNKRIIQECLNLIFRINRAYENTQWGDIEFRWVPGHSGVFGNERADDLANAAIDDYH